ncbi:hypothetical protein CLOM_g4345 [Closterium sp. NIES-68]|nr:hypothetical protein CLOM_g4345 [Closterium sp. NIES-68]
MSGEEDAGLLDSEIELKLSINPNIQVRIGGPHKPPTTSQPHSSPHNHHPHPRHSPSIPPPEITEEPGQIPSNPAAFYGDHNAGGSREAEVTVSPLLDSDFPEGHSSTGGLGRFIFSPTNVGGQITSFLGASVPATLAVFSAAFSGLAFAISSAHQGLPVAVHFGGSDNEDNPRDLTRMPLTGTSGDASLSDPARLQQAWMQFWSDPKSSSIATFVLYQIFIVLIIYLFHLMGASPGVTAFLTTSWAIVFAGNLLLALLLPGLLAREFLRRCAKHDILEAAKVGYSIAGQRRGGRVVVLRGRVSLPSSSASMQGGSNFDGDQGFIIMSTSLQSYHARRATAFYRRREHLRQTLAVDFRISDGNGDSILVCGRRAADRGRLAAFVHHGTVVALASSKRIIGFLDATWLEQEQQFLETHPNLQPSDLVISRGMVTEGQTVSVMGLLREARPLEEDGETIRSSVWSTAHEGMVLEPLPVPVNVGEFFLCWGFFPVYFPTWVSGLLVSDNQGIF